MRHDANHRLGPGIANHQPPGRAEPRLASYNRLLYPARLERLSIAKPDIAQQLRHRLKDAAHLARPPSGLDDCRQHLQRRDQTVAGCRVVGEDDVAGLLAAEIATQAAHLFVDIAIADRGAVQPDPLPGQVAFEAEIGHDRRNQRTAGELPAARQVHRDQRHQLIAIENDATLVGDNQPVCVAIERDPDIGAARQHFAAHLLGRQRATVAVDVDPVRRHGDREHLGAEFPEHRRGDLIAGAMRAIDDDPHAIEPQPFGKALLDKFDVAAGRVVEPLGATELGRGRPVRGAFSQALLDPRFELVGQLVPVAPEQLDPVIGKRVVRGGDDDADIGPEAARQHRDRRGRQWPDQHDVHPHRDKPGGQRRFEHVARQPGVLADHDEVLVRPVVEAFADRHRHLERGLRRHRLGVGGAADTVRSKKLARHCAPIPRFPHRHDRARPGHPRDCRNHKP